MVLAVVEGDVVIMLVIASVLVIVVAAIVVKWVVVVVWVVVLVSAEVLNGLVLCVVVVMVVATVVMVDGLNVLLMFLNILGLMFRPENVFSSSSEESCSCMVFLWLIVIGISVDMLYDDSSGPVLGGLMFVMEFVIGKYRPKL